MKVSLSLLNLSFTWQSRDHNYKPQIQVIRQFTNYSLSLPRQIWMNNLYLQKQIRQFNVPYKMAKAQSDFVLLSG